LRRLSLFHIDAFIHAIALSDVIPSATEKNAALFASALLTTPELSHRERAVSNVKKLYNDESDAIEQSA